MRCFLLKQVLNTPMRRQIARMCRVAMFGQITGGGAGCQGTAARPGGRPGWCLQCRHSTPRSRCRFPAKRCGFRCSSVRAGCRDTPQKPGKAGTMTQVPSAWHFHAQVPTWGCITLAQGLLRVVHLRQDGAAVLVVRHAVGRGCLRCVGPTAARPAGPPGAGSGWWRWHLECSRRQPHG